MSAIASNDFVFDDIIEKIEAEEEHVISKLNNPTTSLTMRRKMVLKFLRYMSARMKNDKDLQDENIVPMFGSRHLGVKTPIKRSATPMESPSKRKKTKAMPFGMRRIRVRTYTLKSHDTSDTELATHEVKMWEDFDANEWKAVKKTDGYFNARDFCIGKADNASVSEFDFNKLSNMISAITKVDEWQLELGVDDDTCAVFGEGEDLDAAIELEMTKAGASGVLEFSAHYHAK